MMGRKQPGLPGLMRWIWIWILDLNHAPGAGSIFWPVDLQFSVLPLCYTRPLRTRARSITWSGNLQYRSTTAPLLQDVFRHNAPLFAMKLHSVPASSIYLSQGIFSLIYHMGNDPSTQITHRSRGMSQAWASLWVWVRHNGTSRR